MMMMKLFMLNHVTLDTEEESRDRKQKTTIFDRERISHGPTSLKIVLVVLVLVATFVQILHLFHEVLVLFIELHRIHEEF